MQTNRQSGTSSATTTITESPGDNTTDNDFVRRLEQESRDWQNNRGSATEAGTVTSSRVHEANTDTTSREPDAKTDMNSRKPAAKPDAAGRVGNRGKKSRKAGVGRTHNTTTSFAGAMFSTNNQQDGVVYNGINNGVFPSSKLNLQKTKRLTSIVQ
ncbi:hypothetical protein Moror_5583 [Moniliophthora roreri MCA 2997]|uniref:Uncharacterized protein n=2 Tax=Moniliophthora roreri TaxID=221103 RepID=V2WMU2_MONRO|nr:hypothetical protein Moror_5583 [Moniliophthora roreri MCA 2997]